MNEKLVECSKCKQLIEEEEADVFDSMCEECYEKRWM